MSHRSFSFCFQLVLRFLCCFVAFASMSGFYCLDFSIHVCVCARASERWNECATRFCGINSFFFVCLLIVVRCRIGEWLQRYQLLAFNIAKLVNFFYYPLGIRWILSALTKIQYANCWQHQINSLCPPSLSLFLGVYASDKEWNCCFFVHIGMSVFLDKLLYYYLLK